MPNAGTLLVIAAVSFVFFGLLVKAASNDRCSAAWALLGPIGVVVAGFRGLHHRLDAAARDAAPTIQARAGGFRVVNGVADATGRIRVACVVCSEEALVTSDECQAYACRRCTGRP
jgi:hypothetical protein